VRETSKEGEWKGVSSFGHAVISIFINTFLHCAGGALWEDIKAFFVVVAVDIRNMNNVMMSNIFCRHSNKETLKLSRTLIN